LQKKRISNGNSSDQIPEMKTIRELLRELDVLGYENIKLVMDRGYYSAYNINALYKGHLKFICGASTSLGFAKEFICEIGSRKDHYEYYRSFNQPVCSGFICCSNSIFPWGDKGMGNRWVSNNGVVSKEMVPSP